MAKKTDVAVTTRAYTMRLKGMAPEENGWRDRVWDTHNAINNGARAFGDWLLTFRGGICHSLADAAVPVKDKPDRAPTPEETKDRRILLALSWLSVESEAGAPREYIVPDEGKGKRRKWKTVETLEDILRKRGLQHEEIKCWIDDCAPAVSAAIRDDAVWVDRSRAFDDAVTTIGESLTRDEAWDLLDRFFNDKMQYLAPVESSTDSEDDDAPAEKIESKVKKAGNWLSEKWGKGKKSDIDRIILYLQKIAEHEYPDSLINKDGQDLLKYVNAILDDETDKEKVLVSDIRKIIGWKGRSSKGETELKRINDVKNISNEDIERLKKKFEIELSEKKAKIESGTEIKEWIIKLRTIYENQISIPHAKGIHPVYSVMLDHAARRVCMNQSWIRLAESNRRRFDKDADKIKLVPADAKAWLDAYRERRAGISGSIDEYIINKRAVEGWEHVVEAWSQPECKTEEDRIKEARKLQGDDDIEKFGDIQLFEALAADDAICVRQKNGKAASENLKNYVAATVAARNKLRFKVPAYRHPDPLLHPVFIDYGNSRLNIKFAAQKPKKGQDIRSLEMTVIRDGAPEKLSLLWQSKKLMADLDLKKQLSGETGKDAPPANVSRADRLGLAASDAGPENDLHIMNVFSEKHWNGRLQAPRAQLEALDRALKKNGGQWDERTLRMKNSIRWLITFSPKLQPTGPWIDYAKSLGLNVRPDDMKKSNGTKYKMFLPAETAALNKGRKSMARILLSRLPGLRVLSVDLGHRIAASCAVWETLSPQQMLDACNAAGRDAPDPNDLYIHLITHNVDGKPKTVIYRRIGADILPDGSPHPAPWARLDRQFPIKLQGEKEKPRKPGPQEYESVASLEKEIGLRESDTVENRFHQVDRLMSHAVRISKLGLRRHTSAARIAHNLITDEKALPGGVCEALDRGDRVKLLTDTLFQWHQTASSSKWNSPFAADLWKEHIEPLASNIELDEPDTQDTRLSAPARKKRNDDLKATLAPAAEILADDNAQRARLHKLWAGHWQNEDIKWKARLRRLRDWLLPSGKSARTGAIRHVGGLSVERITTLKSFYQLQKAFFTRHTPGGRQIEPETGQPLTAPENFAARTLDAIEKMRDNRVKQTASRIAEAALGIGIESKRPVTNEEGRFKGKKHARPKKQVHPPCHAVIVENLRRYRPDELRTRRENRQLMSWASSKIFDHLADACELNGLLLREVSAAYTSRQDSRTGAPGMRCRDIPVKDFMGAKPFWKNELARTDIRLKKDTADSRDDLLYDLRNKWENKDAAGIENARAVRIPFDGGEIFVSADENSPLARGIQADINAAANIGLKALLDPDWPGAWWYIPCNTKTLKPLAKNVGGSDAINTTIPLKTSETKDTDGKKKGSKKAKDIVNMWRDPSGEPIHESTRQPTVFSDTDLTEYTNGKPIHESTWQPTPDYRRDFQNRVVRVLRKYNKLE